MLVSRKRHPKSRLEVARQRVRRAGEAGWDGARSMGRVAAKRARHGMEMGADMLDELPIDDIGDQLRDYLDAARDAIEDTVKGELKDLRKTVRRQRKRMGI